MRSSPFIIVSLFGLAVAGAFQPAAAQGARDFAFTDNEGHRVLRFVGTTASGLTDDQREEIVNAEFSKMVHDRIRADILLDAEPTDSSWAPATSWRIEQYLHEAIEGYAEIRAECRSRTCRVVLGHDDRVQMSEHQARMNAIQPVIESMIASEVPGFEPVFLLTAYQKDGYPPDIKVFLTRAADE